MPQFEQIASRGQIVSFVFVQDNLAASQTDVALNIQEVASAAALLITGISMPSGSIRRWHLDRYVERCHRRKPLC